jgi:hypothetical protein
LAAQLYTAEGEGPSSSQLLIGDLVEVEARLLLTRANNIHISVQVCSDFGRAGADHHIDRLRANGFRQQYPTLESGLGRGQGGT